MRRKGFISAKSQQLDPAVTEVIDQLLGEGFRAQFKDLLNTFGKDAPGNVMTQKSKTSKQKAKAFKDFAISNTGDESEVGTQLNQLDDDAMEEFYVRLCKTLVTGARGFDAAIVEVIDKLMGSDFRGLFRDQLRAFEKDAGGALFAKKTKNSKAAAAKFKEFVTSNLGDDHDVSKLFEELTEDALEEWFVRLCKAYKTAGKHKSSFYCRSWCRADSRPVRKLFVSRALQAGT